jgi:hypothetical protein
MLQTAKVLRGPAQSRDTINYRNRRAIELAKLLPMSDKTAVLPIVPHHQTEEEAQIDSLVDEVDQLIDVEQETPPPCTTRSITINYKPPKRGKPKGPHFAHELTTMIIAENQGEEKIKRLKAKTKEAKKQKTKALNSVGKSRNKIIRGEGKRSKPKKDENFFTSSGAVQILKKRYSSMWDEDQDLSKPAESLAEAKKAQTLPRVPTKYKRHRNSVIKYGTGTDDKRSMKFSSKFCSCTLLVESINTKHTTPQINRRPGIFSRFGGCFQSTSGQPKKPNRKKSSRSTRRTS